MQCACTFTQSDLTGRMPRKSTWQLSRLSWSSFSSCTTTTTTSIACLCTIILLIIMFAVVQCCWFMWRCACALLLLIKLLSCFPNGLIMCLVLGLLNSVSCTVVVTCEAPWAIGSLMRYINVQQQQKQQNKNYYSTITTTITKDLKVFAITTTTFSSSSFSSPHWYNLRGWLGVKIKNISVYLLLLLRPLLYFLFTCV